MKPFMDKDFLLESETAKTLFHDYAENMPIIDYHCHINPMEIAMDRKFDSITQVWLGGDHYKWRQMRTNGIDEKYITGESTDEEKFLAWAKTLEKLVGNPLYHWSHLELQRYFGIYEPLTSRNAKEIFDKCNKILADPSMTVRNIIKKSNVKLICTTDDPVDSLEWHKKIAEDTSFDVKVLPAWRPDKALNIESEAFVRYITDLSAVSDVAITSFETLKEALKVRMDFFASMGCLVSDHALEYVMYSPASPSEIEEIFQNRMEGIIPSKEEELKYKTAFMQFVAREYAKRNWIMQLHYGALRNTNTAYFEKLGPDTGFDCINSYSTSQGLAGFLNSLNITNELPKTIIYSLNPNDNAAIGTVLGCFQDSSAAGKIQQGSAWWFNDHLAGMTEQMTSLANLGMLSNFVGMLTDSRSFLSYTRHEYFRRILCNLLGGWVEKGMYPADLETLEAIVKDISFNNTNRYFGFNA